MGGWCERRPGLVYLRKKVVHRGVGRGVDRGVDRGVGEVFGGQKRTGWGTMCNGGGGGNVVVVVGRGGNGGQQE